MGRSLYRSASAHGDDLQAGRIALNFANAFVWADRHRESGRWYERSLDRLPSEARVERASANLGLAAALLLSDVAECALRASEAHAELTALGMAHYAALADVTLAQADAIRGLHDAARRRLVVLREAFPPDSAERARIEQFLGDAYRNLGLNAEAKDAYRSALASASLRTLPFNALIAQLGLASIAVKEGSYAEAGADLRLAYRRARAKGNALWIATAATMLGELAIRTGDARSAKGRALEALSRLSNHRVGVHHLRARLLLATARRALGEPVENDVREARRIIGLRGFVADRWRIHQLEASAQSGRRRRSVERRMLRAMLEERALRTSLVARRAFFEDKEEAVADYVRGLLDRPTTASVREALDVIGRTRCVTLLDEIVTARHGVASKNLAEDIERLRRQIAEASDEGLDGDGVRRGRLTSGLGRLRRQWSERIEHALGLAQVGVPGPGGATCALLGDDLYRIEDGAVSVVRDLREGLERRLRWLWFDLAARDSSPDRIVEGLKALEAVLPKAVRVVPDALLWSVPWGLVGAVAGRETEVAMHPRFRAEDTALQPEARVLVIAGSRADLPHVELEVQDLTHRFPRATVCRTLGTLRSAADSDEWDVVHVAGHASLDRENPMFSAIHLEDGPLIAAEIAMLGLRTRFAFLDACDTGRLSLEQRAEPAGLVRALLASGPGAVVANAWQVDDDAARVFAAGLYDALLGGRTLLEAMSGARSAVRARYPHPYYWGPFTLFAGYRTES